MNQLFALICIIVISQGRDFLRIQIKRTSSRNKIELKHLQASKLPLNNIMNVQYTGLIQLGSSKQNMNMLLDTGSQISWVIELKTEGIYSFAYSRTQFDCSSSVTCHQMRDQSDQYKIVYGSGSVTGQVTSDIIEVDGALIKEYEFLEVFESTNMVALQADGLLALGNGQHERFPNLIHQMKSQKLIKSGVFQLSLNNDLINRNGESWLVLGGLQLMYEFAGMDPTLMRSEPIYIPIINNNSWVVELLSVKMNTQTLKIQSDKAMIDSGTSLIGIPQSDFILILDELRKKQFCQYQRSQIYCSCPQGNAGDFPTFLFQFSGGKSLSLSPKQYIHEQVSECILAFTKQDGIPNTWILGDAFLQQYVAIFDLDHQRIGFAQQAIFKETKSVQINDTLYFFELLLLALCISILLIMIIRMVTNLSGIRENDEGFVI